MVLTDSKSKQAWIAAYGREIPVFHYGEILPLAWAERTGIGVFLRERRPQLSAADAGRQPSRHRDAAPRWQRRPPACGHNDAFIAAPPGILGLDGFLDGREFFRTSPDRRACAGSRAAGAASAAPVLSFLGSEAAPPRPAGANRPRLRSGRDRLHTDQRRRARPRPALRSDRERDRSSTTRPVFAAFPSCMRMVKSYGFDVMPLIGRSHLHVQTMRTISATTFGSGRSPRARARWSSTAGMSSIRSIARCSKAASAASGSAAACGRAARTTPTALDREKAFDRVIVPNEAFDELNAAYSRGDHVYPVGPVVQESEAVARSARGTARQVGRKV